MAPSGSECEVCHKKQVTISCPNCSTSYCSKRHELEDFKMHRNKCPCYKKIQENGKPTYLVATRLIRKGEVIFESKPLVTGPYGTEPVCVACLCPMIYDVMALLCRGCGWPVCKVDCQDQPQSHRLECSAMKKAGFHFPEDALRGKWNGSSLFSCFPSIWLLVGRAIWSGNAQKILEVYRSEDHEFKNDFFLKHWFDGGATFLRDTLKVKNFNVKDILCMTKVVLRSMYPLRPIGISGEERNGSSGVHVSDIVYLQHACLPNTRVIETINEPEVLKVVAAADILLGEVLFSYKSNIRIGTTAWVRQSFPLSLEGKTCACLMCSDPTEAGLYTGSLSCRECRKSGFMVPKTPLKMVSSDWICENCNSQITARDFSLIIEQISKEFLTILQGRNLHELTRFINYHSGTRGILHLGHTVIIAAKNMYCKFVFDNSWATGANYQFSKKMLETFHKYNSDLCRWHDDLHLEHWERDFIGDMVRSRDIVHQWKNGNLTGKQAVAHLRHVHRSVVTKVDPSLEVDRNVNMWQIRARFEVEAHLRRVHSPPEGN